MIAHFWPLDSQFFGLTVDPFATCSLCVDGLIEWTGAVERGAHSSAAFPIEILDTSFSFDKLLMMTELAGRLWEEKETTEAQSTIARSMIERVEWDHMELPSHLLLAGFVHPVSWESVRASDGVKP